MTAPTEASPKLSYDCLKCPAYCCSYDRIIVEKRDLTRLAKHFGIDVETARRRFTKVKEGEQVLRHQKDKIYGSICMFIDTKRDTVKFESPQALIEQLHRDETAARHALDPTR